MSVILYACMCAFRYPVLSVLTRNQVYLSVIQLFGRRKAGYPGSSMICLSKMAAHGTGFPPLRAVGSGDKEPRLRLLSKHRLTCTGVCGPDAPRQRGSFSENRSEVLGKRGVKLASVVERQSLTCARLGFVCLFICLFVSFRISV